VWIRAGSVIPGKADGSSGGCTTNWGNASFPIGSVDALQFNAGAASGFSGVKVAGACTFTITGGIITNVTGC
jgi:hypothetical protein